MGQDGSLHMPAHAKTRTGDGPGGEKLWGVIITRLWHPLVCLRTGPVRDWAAAPQVGLRVGAREELPTQLLPLVCALAAASAVPNLTLH